MASSLSDIQAPIADELAYFERYFRSAMRTNSPLPPLLDRVVRYILQRKGKQIRPLLVLFSARLCGEITPSTYRGAALIELMHTATLIHDDVVDDSEERRGFFSINALWKNKVAVLVGDFLLSRGLLMALEHNDFELLRIVSQAVKMMSEGELLQTEKSRKLNIDEAVYLEIIRQKTASLFTACCHVGASSTTQDPEKIEHMRLFGECVGIAFQIKDDLLDYGDDDIGKPRAIDIQERKMTLPLIHVLNKSSWGERRRLINIVKNHNRDPKYVRSLIETVKSQGGISYSRQVMDDYLAEARAHLAFFEPGPVRTSLSDLMVYAIERSH
jgi:octaprenyl-diphosphate synthase